MITPDDLNAIIDRIAAGNYTAEDLQVLRREIVLSSDRNVVQLGKYNVNIAEGKDIHVGDRIYQGVDADTIRSLLREQRVDRGRTSMEDTRVDFAIITAIAIERLAVCQAFDMTDKDRVRRENRTYWRKRLPLPSGRFYEIVVAQSLDMATVNAALLTSDLLHHWQPAAVLMVGIAATAKPEPKQHLGDVVIGKEIAYYELGKITAEGKVPEPKQVPVDATLLDRVQSLPKRDFPILADRPDDTNTRPQIDVGVIASGDNVIADAATRDAIAAANRKILAIEMEGYGVIEAARQRFEQVRCLVIRALCDYADSTKNDAWHAYAAAVAAGFTKYFLLDEPLEPPSNGESIKKTLTASSDKESLREALIMARRTLAILEKQAAGSTFLSMSPELQINLEEHGNIIESTETLIKPSGQGIIRVEKGRIINYDFEPLVTKLNKVLDCLGRNGALAFKVRLGKKSVLEEYVIPRIQNELKAKVTRIDPSHTWEEAKMILIDSVDLEACNNRTDQLIENAFDQQKHYHLIDWIDRSANDLLLIVKNETISDEMQIEDITKKCWQRIYDRVCPGLEKKYRCFVIIFAHSFPKIKPYTYKSLDENKIISEVHENKIISLPFKRLQVNSLEKWFRDELHEWGVIAENESDYKRIERYVESIKKHRGDVSETFAEIQRICQELRDRGRIIYNEK